MKYDGWLEPPYTKGMSLELTDQFEHVVRETRFLIVQDPNEKVLLQLNSKISESV